MQTNFMGSTKAAQIGFAVNFSNNGGDSKLLLGFTADSWTAYQSAVLALVAAQTQADAATAAAVAATNVANAQLDAVTVTIRAAANSGRVSTLSDDVLATLGISRRSLSPTPIAAPAVAPSIRVDGLSGGVATIGFSTPGGSGARSKPDGAVTTQVSMRDVASTAPPEAGIMTVSGRNPIQIDTTLTTASRVKVVARFLNAKGQAGPWSDSIQFNPQTV